MKKIFLTLLSLAALMVCAKTIIMKVEMKDGNVRYIDTEAVDEFSFMQLDEIPETPDDGYLTQTLAHDAHWYHRALFSNIDRGVTVTDRYVANNPVEHTFKISGWGNGCAPITIMGVQEGYDVALEVPCQPIGYNHPEYGAIWIADAAHYSTDILGSDKKVANRSYYSAYGRLRHDKITLDVVYYAPDYQDGKTFSVAALEYIAAPGYGPVDFNYAFLKETDGYVAHINATSEAGLVDHIEACWKLVEESENPFEELTTQLNNGGGTVFKVGEDPTALFTVKPDATHFNVVIVYRTYDAEGQIIGDPAAIHNCIKSIDEYSGYENWVASGKYYTMLYGGEYPASLLQTMNCDGNTVSTSYRINFGAPFDVVAIADDAYNADEKLRIKVYVPGFSTGITVGENDVWGASVDWYMENVYSGSGQIDYEPGYYAPFEGVMRIPMIYYPKDDTSGVSYGGVADEYFVYNGFDNPFVDALTATAYQVVDNGDGSSEVYVEYTQARQKADNIRAIVTDMSVGNAIDYIETNAADIIPISCKGQASGAFAVHTELTGSLNVVAVLFDADGNILGSSSDEVVIKDLNPSEWSYIGKATFEDGWITVLNNGNPFVAADHPWQVDLYQSVVDPTLYCLDKPWSSDYGWPYARANDTTHHAEQLTLKFRIVDGHVIVEPQASGFANGTMKFTVANYEGYIAADNPQASLDDILSYMDENGIQQSTITDNTVYIPIPLVDIGSGQFQRWASEPQPARIYFPAEAAGALAGPAKTARTAATAASRSALSLKAPEVVNPVVLLPAAPASRKATSPSKPQAQPFILPSLTLQPLR